MTKDNVIAPELEAVLSEEKESNQFVLDIASAAKSLFTDNLIQGENEMKPAKSAKKVIKADTKKPLISVQKKQEHQADKEESEHKFDLLFTVSEMTMKMSENLNNSLVNYSNNLFATNMDLSKELFGCKTFTDMISLQEKFVVANMNASSKEAFYMVDSLLDFSNNLTSAINEQVTANMKITVSF